MKTHIKLNKRYFELEYISERTIAIKRIAKQDYRKLGTEKEKFILTSRLIQACIAYNLEVNTFLNSKQFSDELIGRVIILNY